jgi:tetratricopeptide (TPR) repeat protein
VLSVAVAAHATSLGNGFANDDETVVAGNPVVTEARWHEALLGPYWQGAREGAGLYRPVTIGSFTAEWWLWRGAPLGFHAVSVVAHAVVSLLVLGLLVRLAPVGPACLGALFFALHPVHVEAVANVVGRSELYAALAFLGACILYLDGARWTGSRRVVRTGGLVVLYLLALGSKEIAVTLPAVLVLLELARSSDRPLSIRLRAEAPVLLSLGAALGTYLLLRTAVLGTVVGEAPVSWLRDLPVGPRVLTALSFWGEYLRLMIAPMDLSSEYAPGVLSIRRDVDLAVVVGALILVAWLAASVRLWRIRPIVALGLAWFLVTMLPIANLLFPVGMLVAERTLYLPSAGGSVALAGALACLPATLPPRRARALVAFGLLLGGAYLWRAVTRGPVWRSTGSVVGTLTREHPESYVALLGLAIDLTRAGRAQEAAEVYDRAYALAPGLYGVTVATADAAARAGDAARAEALLRRAIELRPGQPDAHRLLAGALLKAGRGREAHGVALHGLARAGADATLWAHVSESYVLKGDLVAAARARRAAVGLDPTSPAGWARLAEILDAAGDASGAARARARVHALEGRGTSRPGGAP